MTALTVRRLLIDLDAPVARHWCGNDAFRSAFFGALSMSFPVGEQFFIDAVRQGLQALPSSSQDRFRDEVQGFIGQEATHRRIHGQFNARLAEHGLTNHWEARARSRLKLLEGQNARHALAITAANEHFTALFAEWMLAHPDWLKGSEPRLQMLWLWHAAEEAEHKCTAFDLYRALGGNEHWRRIWMRRVTVIFLTDALRQTLSNLRSDGTLWRLSTWRSAAAFLFGRTGLLRFSFHPWRAWFRPDFHPGQQHTDRSAQWLLNNRVNWQPVGTQR